MSELWLSGPIEGVPPPLMPAAHSFLQVREDAAQLLGDLSTERIWSKVGGSATIGFHALHIVGSTDRLLTYARCQQLSDEQVQAARAENTTSGLDAADLIARIQRAMDAALDHVRATPESALREARGVGKKQLPSTMLGLIAHAAEHAYRHAGQIATLKRIVG